MNYRPLDNATNYLRGKYNSISQKISNSIFPNSGLELTVDNSLNTHSDNVQTQGNLTKRIARIGLPFALAGYLLASSACSNQATPIPTYTPTPQIETIPTPIPRPMASSWDFRFGEVEYWIYLTGFSREPNPEREGWDRVNASFSLYQLPDQPGYYWEPKELRVKDDLLGIGTMVKERFGLQLSWDGGSKAAMKISPSALEKLLEVNLTYLRAIPLTINTDVPSIATNLTLVPVTQGNIELISGKTMTPRVWEPESLQQAYLTLVSSHLLQFEELSNNEVKYSELSRRLEEGNLVLEIEVQNLSMQRDLDLQRDLDDKLTGVRASHSSFGWPMFLAADGRYVGDGRALEDSYDGTNPHFDWGERKVVPPGFKAQGKLVLPLFGKDPKLEYVFLFLRLPGLPELGWRLLDIPNN